MAPSSGRHHGRALARLTTAAIAAALVGTAGTAVADDKPTPLPAPVKRAQAQSAELNEARRAEAPTSVGANGYAPILPLAGATATGDLYYYMPNGKGGLLPRQLVVRDDWAYVSAAMHVDRDDDGVFDGMYARGTDGTLAFTDDTSDKEIGPGWNRYNVLLSPGNLGGAREPDLLARDGSGTLWLHLARPDATLTGRKKVGTGWGRYTQIAGQHDLTDDGRADIVARDKAGVLWLYKGTGDANKPFATRTRIGSGWNTYNRLVASGDVDLDADGRADLIARDTTGALWLYKGTGKASAPFAARVKIGNSGWNQYTQLFS
ncbi:VCBS repeat-containing protein [Streptomyces sp. LX-29]|uniref:FG-GAP repeat domain-containing protein n=1 Tax=Streptomyces sp. LX-29 TaxID=2900152 RepID=UPI00240E73FF|nr:VCBS repeat-containing protein [Streptomyces sp. LX-29]WFB06947.1 VCBS repeat-containing protein [Streptomyces sp. LX-29]